MHLRWFIYSYSRIFKRSPAEADLGRHFEVAAPFVHEMVVALEKLVSANVNPERLAASNSRLLLRLTHPALSP